MIIVAGSQTIVRYLDQALRRIDEHVLPYEDALVFERLKIHTFVGQILIIRRGINASLDP